MLSLLLATLLTQATMSPSSDLSTNRVRATGAAGARALRDHLRTLPDVYWDSVTVSTAHARATGASTTRTLADHLRTLPDAEIVASGARTSRTLPEWFADEIKVKATGAACDGVTDDSAAFARAMALAEARGGGTVVMPEGTC